MVLVPLSHHLYAMPASPNGLERIRSDRHAYMRALPAKHSEAKWVVTDMFTANNERESE